MNKLLDLHFVRIVAAFLSGFLWMLCFEPFGFSAAAFIAFVPWYFALTKMSRLEIVLSALIVSGFLSFGNLGWISHLHIGGFAAVIVYFWIGTMIIGFSTNYAHKKGFVLSSAIIVSTFVSLEVIRTYINLPVTFPWLKFGYSQSNFVIFAQIADIGGAYLVSGVLIFINWAIVKFVTEILIGYKRRQLLMPASALILFIIVMVYGVARIYQIESAKIDGPTVALIQPNNTFPSRKGQDNFTTINEYAKKAVSKADIIAIPETSLYAGILKLDVDGKLILTNFGKYWLDDIFNSSTEVKAKYIVGGITLETDEENKYLNGVKYKTNSSVTIAKSGEVSKNYSKIELVPIGEFVPYLKYSSETLKLLGPILLFFGFIIFLSMLIFSKRIKRIFKKRSRTIIWIIISILIYSTIILTGSAYLKDIMVAGFESAGLGEEYIPNDKPGENFTKFNVNLNNGNNIYYFATPICYELAYPRVLRKLCYSDKIEADFILNLSNDNFYKQSAELDQMLNIAKFRCIENRKAMGRCTTTGISAFVSATGKIDDFIEVDGKTKEVEGLLIRNISVHKGRSIYNKLGDLFAWLCFGFFILSIVVFIYKQKDIIKS